MREEGPANDKEDCPDNEAKGPFGLEPKESVVQKPEPEGWFQSFVIGPIIARSLALNPLGELKNPPKANLIYGALVLSAFMAVPTILIMLDTQRNGPAAARAERELNDEFRRIQVPAPSCLQHSESSSKPHIAFVQASYDTTLTYAEVCAHYDAELSAQGWRYLDQYNWGRLITRCYSKGVYEAHVTFEEGLFGGRTLGLGMSWGIGTCRERLSAAYSKRRPLATP